MTNPTTPTPDHDAWMLAQEGAPKGEGEREAPSFQSAHRLEGWIAPADLYAAINRLAEMNPDAKHVCWDMLVLAHDLPRTLATTRIKGE